MTLDHSTMPDDELMKYLTDLSTDENNAPTSEHLEENIQSQEDTPTHSHSDTEATAQTQKPHNASHEITQPSTKKQKVKRDSEAVTYSYKSFAELCKKPEPIRFLIEDYVQEGALHLDYGEYGCGKSFVALDQACSIACTEIEDWHGMKISHAPVIYFAGEGATGLRKRCALWAHEHNVNPESVQLVIIEEVFKLNDENDDNHNIQTTLDNIKRICDGFNSNPGLVIIDTLNRYIEGDENKAVDVGKFISTCSLIIRELGCAVKIVHHVGNALENKGRPRGSSSLIAAVDIATLHDKRGENHVHIDQTKNKENQLKKGLILNLKQGTLPPEWNDDYGNPTTSCVVELDPSSTHNQPYIPDPASEKKLTKTQKRARETYQEAAIRHGVKYHDEQTGRDFAAVYIEDWRNVSYEMSSAEDKNVLRVNFNRERRTLYEEDHLLIKKCIEGNDYYCLDLQEKSEDGLRTIVASAIGRREREQAEQAKLTTGNGA